jgi:hypothetical protein
MEVYSDKDEIKGRPEIFVLGQVVDKQKPAVAVGVWFSLDLGVLNAYRIVRGGARRATLEAARDALIYSKEEEVSPTLVVPKSFRSLLNIRRPLKSSTTEKTRSELMNLLEETSADVRHYEERDYLARESIASLVFTQLLSRLGQELGYIPLKPTSDIAHSNKAVAI